MFPESVATCAVSTRLGGVSAAPYASLNLALHVGDDAAAVRENRNRFCAALGLDARAIVTPEQVHGDVIYQAKREDAGRGSMSYDDAIKGTDALMTNESGLPLMLCYADCTPIVMLDPVHHAAAVAHGGWKGTVSLIAAKTIAAMGEAYGTRPEDVLVGIGPAIGPCCYEVGNDVAARFDDVFADDAKKIVSVVNGKKHVNLWAANKAQLVKAGVLPEHIDAADVCTSCNHELFYSYRAENGKTGRIASIIALK